MKNLKRCFAMVLILAMMILPISAGNVFAAAGVTISSPDTVNAGEAFTVIVKYNADSLARVSGKMSYNPEMIEYISGGASSGNGGVVQLKGQSDSGTDVTFELRFKAVYKSTNTLKVTTKEMYDLDEQLISNANPVAKMTITVQENGEQTDAGENQNEEKKTQDENVDQNEDQNEDQNADNEEGGAIEKSQDSGIPGYVYFIIAAALVVLIIIVATAMSRSKRKKHESKH